MLITICKSKIHRATVTEANIDYEGSISIDAELMEAASIAPYERVQVVNISNGNRLETYAIEGERGTGTICLNGAAAHKGKVGDLIIVICYGIIDQNEVSSLKPTVVRVDSRNKIIG
jgi:aspartate 1-decarboxylase